MYVWDISLYTPDAYWAMTVSKLGQGQGVVEVRAVELGHVYIPSQILVFLAAIGPN